MLKVLLVDDRTSVCDGLRKLVPWQELQAEIVGDARNGQEALDIAVRHHPDVIITDIKMPVMDGLSLCREIHERMPETVMIVLSAYDDFAFAQNALRFGVTDYVLKPIDREKLNQIIRKISEISYSLGARRSLYNSLYRSEIQDDVDNVLKQGVHKDILSLIERMFLTVDPGSLGLGKELCLKLSDLLFQTIEENEFNVEMFPAAREKVIEEILQFKTTEHLRKYIEDLYQSTAQIIQVQKNSHRGTTVELLRHYIHRHYMDPSLSVVSLAASVSLSPNYTSWIFRQVTGDNLTDYITHLRMEKARGLFKDPTKQISDVAKLVGYHDSHYFTRVFKSVEGLTPTQYRNLANSEKR